MIRPIPPATTSQRGVAGCRRPRFLHRRFLRRWFYRSHRLVANLRRRSTAGIRLPALVDGANDAGRIRALEVGEGLGETGDRGVMRRIRHRLRHGEPERNRHVFRQHVAQKRAELRDGRRTVLHTVAGHGDRAIQIDSDVCHPTTRSSSGESRTRAGDGLPPERWPHPHAIRSACLRP